MWANSTNSFGLSGLSHGMCSETPGVERTSLKMVRAVFQLLEDAARLARAGEACEARPARADAPRRHGDAKRLRFANEVFDVHAAPL